MSGEMAIRKYEKHLAFYEMRDELKKAKHCAFCTLERKRMHQYFDGLLYEKVNDPGIRRSLVRSAGFCPRHAHMLAGFGDSLGTAILYQDQIRLRMKTMEKMGSPLRKSRKPSPSAAKKQEDCPACRIEGQMRMGHAHSLLQGLTDPEMVDAFETSAGLCFPHFTFAVNEAEDPGVRSVLIRVQKEKMERLSAQLKEFMDKHDYRRISEGFAEEKDSWLRAVELVSGLKNVF